MNQIQLWKDERPLRIRATAAAKSERAQKKEHSEAPEKLPNVSMCTLKTIKRLRKRAADIFYGVVRSVSLGRVEPRDTEQRQPPPLL